MKTKEPSSSTSATNMTGIEEAANRYVSKVVEALRDVDTGSVARFTEMLLDTYVEERTVFYFGNGGSAANASHASADLLAGVSRGLDRRFRSMCLSDSIPAMMAIANDISYEQVFVEQLRSFIRAGDLAVGISGSGQSANVCNAVDFARSAGARTVAICGFDGGRLKDLADLVIHVRSNNMEAVEDVHLIVLHCVKTVLMGRLKPSGSPSP